MTLLPLLATFLFQYEDDGAGIIGALFSGVSCICWLIIIILIVAGLWKTFEKAGQPGWAAIIPIYNLYIMLKMVGREAWWIILFFIPIINIVMPIILGIDMAKSFGKDTLYGVLLLWLFSPIGYLILGFSDAQYIGPAAAK
ncbi:MAG: signal peptidase I [Chloroflexi bacterium]|nr:signal peptidase I [Chloroflexota bacterium]